MQMHSFVYKWTFKPDLYWYVGFHTGTIDDGYICSSSNVKQAIINEPELWERTIIGYGTTEEMYELESEILQLFDARNDPRSLNLHNNKLARPGWNKDVPNSIEHNIKISITKTGKTSGKKGNKYFGSHSDEACEKKRVLMIGNVPGNKGKPWSEERRQKQQLANARKKLAKHNIH